MIKDKFRKVHWRSVTGLEPPSCAWKSDSEPQHIKADSWRQSFYAGVEGLSVSGPLTYKFSSVALLQNNGERYSEDRVGAAGCWRAIFLKELQLNSFQRWRRLQVRVQRWALRSQTPSWNAESIKMDVGPQTCNWFLKLWQITAEEENPTKLRQCDSTGWSLLNFLLRLNNLCSMTRVTLLLLRSHRTSHVFSVTGEAELLFEVKTVWVGKFPPDKILLHNLHN